MLYMHKYEELYDKKVRNHVHTWEEGYLQVEKKNLFLYAATVFIVKFP